jgi:hypothetical protein
LIASDAVVTVIATGVAAGDADATGTRAQSRSSRMTVLGLLAGGLRA